MNYFILSTLISAILYGLFSLTRQLQMLQQNSYFPSRYTNWLKSNIPFLPIAAYLLISLLICFKLYSLTAAFTAVVTAASAADAVRTQKRSIKKLIFTARIKRLYACALIVFIIPLSFYIIYRNSLSGGIFASVLLLLTFISPITVYICWALTYPLEKAVSKWYVNDAKRILKEHNNLKVIGITGSYGKTTTKFILNRILSEKFNTVCTPQSFNTPMGVVRTVRGQLKPQTQIFICEMGAKNTGDIKEICDIVHPDYGIITSVGAQHLETFKTIDNVFKTKFELADAVKLKGGKTFVNADSYEIKARIKDNEYTVYGTADNCDFTAENISYGRNGSEFDLKLGNEKIHLTSRLLGLHSIINIVGAAALAYTLGVSADDIKYAVASLKAYEHRLEMKQSVAGSVLIDDAYNANPEGSIEAVRVLGSFDGMKKVIITPGLIELGEKEYECNYNLGLETADKCDIIIFVGKNRSKPMQDAVNSTEFDKSNMFIAASFSEAMNIYSRFADSNTVLLIENDLPDNYLT